MTNKDTGEPVTTDAGSLSSAHIGQTVEVTWQQGKITSTIRDVLESFCNRGANVTLFFKGTQWTPAVVIGTARDTGLTVPCGTQVKVGGGN